MRSPTHNQRQGDEEERHETAGYKQYDYDVALNIYVLIRDILGYLNHTVNSPSIQ